jgi:hypothetical protein
MVFAAHARGKRDGRVVDLAVQHPRLEDVETKSGALRDRIAPLEAEVRALRRRASVLKR